MNRVIHNEVQKNMHHALLHHNVLIAWKPDYNLGIPVIDEHHRGIVTTINSLYYGMQNKQDSSIIAPVVVMVYEYTHLHFKIEESLIEELNFPGVKQHHKLHEELVDKLSEYRKRNMWEQEPLQFLNFLKAWWIEHICEKDREFRDYIVKMKNW